MNTKTIKQDNKQTIALRAKNALSVFANTGSGIAALNSFVFPSFGNGFFNNSNVGSGWGWLSIAPRDFDYEKVNAYNSSIVMACINWIISSFREATPLVKKFNKDGVESLVPNHRFIKFLRRPNPYYNLSKLMSATLISYYLDGNAYWFKERVDGGLGNTVAVYYIPHYMITPKSSQNGGFIDYYEYNVNGKSYRIEKNRIVHFRNELDPYNPLSGRKILHPVLSEIFTDEEAAKFVSALLRNSAIPGVIISPETEKVEVTQSDADELKENFKKKFGGDNRGEALILNFAAKIQQMGFNPEQLQFTEVRRLPEERVASQFRIAPVVAGLGAGLDKSTYSNYEQAEKHSYQSCLIPLWEEMAEEIETQLLPEFCGGDKDYTFSFDYSSVRALQESQNDLTTRLRNLWLADAIVRAELRSGLGFEIDEGRDKIFYSETRIKTVLPSSSPVKRFFNNALTLIKSTTPQDNLNEAFERSLEADVKTAIDAMEEDLITFYSKLSLLAEERVKTGVDRFNPETESERITGEVFKGLEVGLVLLAIWSTMAENLKEANLSSISLRLGISDFWDSDAEVGLKSLITNLSKDYNNSLLEQTKLAVKKALLLAEEGQSVTQIAKSVKEMVAGREMYPGIFEEGYKKALEAGATEEEALRAGESKARRYRAKLIAETESRTYQNLTTLEGFSKAGVEKVKVTDGDGCGWKSHNDNDKAHNTTRLIVEAKKHSLAHPNCKRRFYPVTN